jgi:hypothetical protein
MPVALTDGMSVLKVAARKVTLLLAAVTTLCSVACAGTEEDHPSYASTDIAASEAKETGRPVECAPGSVDECTIWLGQHGDLSNCVHGLNVCADGAWTGCIDEATLSENPDLYGDLTAN